MATTTNYGWTTPDNTAYVKDGASAIRTLGSSVDTTLFNITTGKNVGMVHLTTQTFTASSGIILSSIFSSTYDNYVIEHAITAVSGTPTVTFQLRTGSTTVSTNYASSLLWTGGSGTNGVSRATNAFYSFGQSQWDTSSIVIKNPFKTQPTTYTCLSMQGSAIGVESGVNSNSTSYESLVVGNAIGGLNTGTVRVYGLRNS